MALVKQPAKKRIRNKEERRRAQRRYYLKTKDSRRAIRLAQTRAWIKKNPEYHKNYRREHAGETNAKTAKRRASKKRATPKWLTKTQLYQIQIFYKAANLMKKETGISFEVDHIVPLQGELISGLHVPWNLQVLPLSDNRKKSNHHGTC